MDQISFENPEYDYPELVGDSRTVATNGNNFNSNYMQTASYYDVEPQQYCLRLLMERSIVILVIGSDFV